MCRFWIDKECSPEEESSEKQTTMNSMELLYRTSRHAIGLLAVILETQSEVNYLQTLMMGHAISRGSGDEYPSLAHSTTSHASSGIFEVLVHMHTDRWWTRAWIFQEEYLSSTHANIDPTRARSSREASVWFSAWGNMPKCRGVSHSGDALSACFQVGGPPQLCQEVRYNAQDVWMIQHTVSLPA
jgi:hypothetical protein